MDRHSRAMCLASLVIASATVSYPYHLDSHDATPAPKQPAQPTPKYVLTTPESPVFLEWIAVGSGCHAKWNEAGDVTMERITTTAEQNIHVVRFHLDRLRLSSAQDPSDTPLNFAKECSIRIQVFPPEGKRIKNLFARTSVVSIKSPGTKLTLAGTLRIGAQVLDQKIVVEQAGMGQTGEEAFELFHGRVPGEVFPSLNCNQAKLGGFDFTWIAERTQNTDEVLVEVADEKVLEMSVELEDCS